MASVPERPLRALSAPAQARTLSNVPSQPRSTPVAARGADYAQYRVSAPLNRSLPCGIGDDGYPEDPAPGSEDGNSEYSHRAACSSGGEAYVVDVELVRGQSRAVCDVKFQHLGIRQLKISQRHLVASPDAFLRHWTIFRGSWTRDNRNRNTVGYIPDRSEAHAMQFTVHGRLRAEDDGLVWCHVEAGR